MKYIVLSILGLCCLPSARAQDGLFLQPGVGVGMTNVTGRTDYSTLDLVWAKPKSPLTTVNPQLLAGYGLRTWVITAGVSYLVSGYREHYKYWEFAPIEVNNAERYDHYVFQAGIARKYSIGKWIRFLPGAGMAVSYNASARENSKTNDIFNNPVTYNRTLSKTEFDRTFHRAGVWGLLKANIAYKLNNRLSVITGPELQYMLTNMAKAGMYADKNPGQRHYAVTCLAGFTWNCNKSHEKAVP